MKFVSTEAQNSAATRIGTKRRLLSLDPLLDPFRTPYGPPLDPFWTRFFSAKYGLLIKIIKENTMKSILISEQNVQKLINSHSIMSGTM